jgi:hypothetical protein
MSYPSGPPGNSGYPPAQQPTNQFSAPTQQFGKLPEVQSGAADGPSQLPLYLTAVVAVLGLAAYLSSFGPLLSVGPIGDAGQGLLPVYVCVLPTLAALLAGVALLPKQKARAPHIAVLAVLGLLVAVSVVLTTGDGIAIDWGLYLIIAFSVLQAIVAVAVLLFDAGVITPPVPRPRYEQQYSQYGAPYYGQQHPGQQHPGGPHQPGPQRPGYPSQYGGYPGGSGAPSGGFASAPQGGTQSGPPTPPTGFPTYGQPPSNSTPTAQAPAQPESPSPSTQSGPPPS